MINEKEAIKFDKIEFPENLKIKKVASQMQKINSG